jgi:hypothetical protein
MPRPDSKSKKIIAYSIKIIFYFILITTSNVTALIKGLIKVFYEFITVNVHLANRYPNQERISQNINHEI